MGAGAVPAAARARARDQGRRAGASRAQVQRGMDLLDAINIQYNTALLKTHTP